MKRICVYCGSSPGARPEYASMLLIDESPESLLTKFEANQPPRVDKAAWALRTAGR